jgi:hypothetical protein
MGVEYLELLFFNSKSTPNSKGKIRARERSNFKSLHLHLLLFLSLNYLFVIEIKPQRDQNVVFVF